MPYITNELRMNFPYDEKDSPMYRMIFNKQIIDSNGHFRAERLHLLGLMRCRHLNIESKYSKFWDFVNPELDEKVKAGEIMNMIEEMAIISLPVL